MKIFDDIKKKINDKIDEIKKYNEHSVYTNGIDSGLKFALNIIFEKEQQLIKSSSEIASLGGKIGGRSKSPDKVRSAKDNLVKARESKKISLLEMFDKRFSDTSVVAIKCPNCKAVTLTRIDDGSAAQYSGYKYICKKCSSYW